MERLEAKQVKGHTYYLLLEMGLGRQSLSTRLAEIPRQTRGHRRGRSRGWASACLRRRLAVSTRPGWTFRCAGCFRSWNWSFANFAETA